MDSVWMILCLAVLTVAADEYGIPFQTYGPPSSGGDLQEELRPRPLAHAEGEALVAPPNSRVDLRDDKNQYSVGFQDPDGTEVKEQGRLISTDNGWEYVIAKTGSYRYVSPEGIPVSVRWVADEKGFRVLED